MRIAPGRSSYSQPRMGRVITRHTLLPATFDCRLDAAGVGPPPSDLKATGILGLALRPGALGRGRSAAAEAWARDAERHLKVSF